MHTQTHVCAHTHLLCWLDITGIAIEWPGVQSLGKTVGWSSLHQLLSCGRWEGMRQDNGISQLVAQRRGGEPLDRCTLQLKLHGCSCDYRVCVSDTSLVIQCHHDVYLQR